MSSIYTNLATAISGAFAADTAIKAKVTTFSITESDLQGLIDNIHSLRIDPDKLPAVFTRVLEPPPPERFTTNEELYEIPVEVYTIVRHSDYATAYSTCEGIVELLEPFIRKQKDSTYNFSHLAYTTGAMTNYPYDRINVNDVHYCIATTKFSAIKIYSY